MLQKGPLLAIAATRPLSINELIHIINKDHDINKEFWDYAEARVSRFYDEFEKIFRVRYSEYDTKSVRATFLTLTTHIEMIAGFRHALGLMNYFNDEPKHIYSKTLNLVANHQFPDTILSMILNTLPAHSLTNGYYNLSFQESLLNSLKVFRNHFISFEANVLELCINNLEKSIEYYNYFSKNNAMPTSQIKKDLSSGSPRMFTTGRWNPSFHSTNAILSDKYIIFCDRFDVDEFGINDRTKNYTLTNRNSKHGIYAYKLSQPFSLLENSVKNKLIKWLTISMSYSDGIFGINEALNLPAYPEYSLKAKEQSKGSCRYASKKQGVGGLMLSAVLALIDQGVSPISTTQVVPFVEKMHKAFKRFDRLQQIDRLCSSILPEADKIQLLLLAFIRNTDFEKPLSRMDLAIVKRIKPYLKKYVNENNIHKIETIFETLINGLIDENEKTHVTKIFKRFNRIINRGRPIVPCPLSATPITFKKDSISKKRKLKKIQTENAKKKIKSSNEKVKKSKFRALRLPMT